MPFFQISHRQTSEVFGEFDAPTMKAAVEEFARENGFTSFAELAWSMNREVGDALRFLDIREVEYVGYDEGDEYDADAA